MRNIGMIVVRAIVATGFIGAVFTHAAAAPVLKTLYSFGGSDNGAFPNTASLIYEKGELYGTLNYTSGVGYGQIFSLNAKTGAKKTLYTFIGGEDGGVPQAGVIDEKGILYGTASQGGNTYGVVYSFDLATGKEKVLHAFTSNPDGNDPLGPLIDVSGDLYGTTEYGGTIGEGTVFKLSAMSGKGGTFYSFIGSGGEDGAYPIGGLVYADGAVYGATYAGGENTGNGAVFKINLKTGGETVLYRFGTGNDAIQPNFSLTYVSGTLYGTTMTGGSSGDGAIFSVDAKSGSETVLYNFTGKSDGGFPQCTLVAENGILYGTTSAYGALNSGTIFEFDPASKKLTTLHSFSGGDGSYPLTGLTYAKGLFYGTTSSGGGNGAGTAFSFMP
jgi:uncharacterized repeat protein (TIGR03803 family)